MGFFALMIIIGILTTNQPTEPQKAPDTGSQNVSPNAPSPQSDTQAPNAPAPPAPVQSNDMSHQVLASLKQYMYDNFGGAGYSAKYVTSWYPLINSYEVSFSDPEYDVVVRTSIWDDSDATKPANAIFGAIRCFDKYRIGRITIYGRSSSGDRILRDE